MAGLQQISVEYYTAVKKECSLETMKWKIFRKYYVKKKKKASSF